MSSTVSSGRSPTLPTPTLPLIGREDEAALLHALLLQAHVHLITLRGPGGIGKTRLALEVAHEARAHFALGVTFVDLAPLRDAAHVLPALALALHVPLGSDSPLDAITRHVAGKSALVLLDNFEHVRAAATELAVLLAQAPSLKVLVTSRVILNLTAEYEVPLLPLDVTNEDGAAVALFVQRARTVDPSFRLDAHTRGLVLQVCRTLDGVPLALELAAARTRVLSLPDLASRLHRSLKVLSGGPRDQPERLRSLRTAIEWSYALLDSSERALLQACSVFAGGFTLDAVEQVTQQEDVLDRLSSLVEQSLVHRDRKVDGRWMLLESLREFAVEKLEESGHAPVLRDRHLGYFHDLLLDAETRQQSSELSAQDRARVEVELPNLRLALTHAEGTGRGDAARRMMAVLGLVLYPAGRFGELRAWCERALNMAGPGNLGVDGRVHLWAARCAMQFEDCAEFRRHVLASLEAARSVGDRRYEALGLSYLGISEADGGRFEEAERLMLEAAATQRASGFLRDLAITLDNLGIVIFDAYGDVDRDIALLKEATDLRRKLNDTIHLCGGLYKLGIAYFDLGDLQSSYRAAVECAELAVTHGYHGHLRSGVRCLALLAGKVGEHERAARWLGFELLLHERHDALPDALQRAVAQRRTVVQAARSTLDPLAFEAAWASGRHLTPERFLQEVQAWTPALADTPVSAPRAGGAADLLTPRERDVVVLAARGLSDKKVAQQLAISANTVSKHLANVLGKLALHNRVELACWALEQGLTSNST